MTIYPPAIQTIRRRPTKADIRKISCTMEIKSKTHSLAFSGYISVTVNAVHEYAQASLL